MNTELGICDHMYQFVTRVMGIGKAGEVYYFSHYDVLGFQKKFSVKTETTK
jgi:hypothetical protein